MIETQKNREIKELTQSINNLKIKERYNTEKNDEYKKNL